jgi:MYXO-CTERM domain-containing protein
VATDALPATSAATSHVDPLLPEVSAPILLSATAAVSGGGYDIAPLADAQVASGHATTNYGTSTNIYVQSSSTSAYGDERAWLKFDLSSIPAGSTITGATLQLWNWKSTGASLPVEVRSSNDDSWTETGLTWSNQPALGSVLDTQTLASGTINVTYNWNVTAFVQSQFSGDKTVSLLAKPVSEGSADATAPSYGFDAREYGSNAPVLHVTTQASASSVANVRFFYRYSTDNAAWGAWTQAATDTAAPYNTSFSFPNGAGYYEFYSVATDNLGGVESTPAFAQAAVHYQAASGAAQSINFAQPADVPVGSAFSVSATASSGLAVTFSSQTAGICTVSGELVTTVAPGTCTIAANQAGDAGYWLAATLTRSFTVQALAQSISFPGIASQVLGNGPVVMNAIASSGLSVQYTSQTLAVCTVSGNSVTLVAVGTCTIAANQAGGGNYAAAPTVTQSFSVTAATGSEDGDVPLPEWAMAMLALVLLETMRRRRMGRKS